MIDPAAILAKLSGPITQATTNIIHDIQSSYVVPDRVQAPGVESAGYREAISRSQYEVYSFTTKNNHSEAAVDELLGMLSNVHIYLEFTIISVKLHINYCIFIHIITYCYNSLFFNACAGKI